MLLCAGAMVLAPVFAGCAASGVAPPGTARVTYEIRHHRPTAQGPVLEFAAQHEFSGDWRSWTDVTTATDDEVHNRAGPQSAVYENGTISFDGLPPEPVGDPGEPFNPGPLFNLEHSVVSDDERLLADETTSQELLALRDRVAERLGLAPDSLRATRVEELGVCDKAAHGCPTGVLTEVTTAVLRRADALPLHVTRLDNGILSSELEVSSLE
ncbi:MAG TPA: hypothetical protein VGW38_11415 [Chloroflexota bacterium]|nr:hypothetical protein [Chloroflexota bacterium]